MSKNNMIQFADGTRTTGYFLTQAIQEIRIAYRIMEYLAPDDIFPPKIDKDTKELIFYGRYEDAVERIIDNEIICVDIDSSSGAESLVRDAIELIEFLLPIYKQNVKDKTEKRRLELLAELKELESADETKQ